MAKRGRKPLSEARAMAVKELRNVYAKLRARVNRVQAKYGETPAIEEYYKRGLDKLSTKGLELEDINNLRIDIDYISSLKTTYMEGAEHYSKYVSEWVELYENDRGMYNRIMMLYNRLVEENELVEKFKYQVIEDIYTMVEKGGATNKEIYSKVKDAFNDLYLNTRIEDLVGGSSYETGGKVRSR